MWENKAKVIRMWESSHRFGTVLSTWHRRVVRKEDEHFSPLPEMVGIHLVDAEKTRPC